MHNSHRRSPASLILTCEGITLSRFVEPLRVSVSAVSMQWAGRRRLHPALVPGLGAGPEVASEVAAASHHSGGVR